MPCIFEHNQPGIPYHKNGGKSCRLFNEDRVCTAATGQIVCTVYSNWHRERGGDREGEGMSSVRWIWRFYNKMSITGPRKYIQSNESPQPTVYVQFQQMFTGGKHYVCHRIHQEEGHLFTSQIKRPWPIQCLVDSTGWMEYINLRTMMMKLSAYMHFVMFSLALLSQHALAQLYGGVETRATIKWRIWWGREG